MNFLGIWPTVTPYMRYFDFSLWSTVLCFLFCHIISHRRLVYKFEEEILRCAKFQVRYECHWSNYPIPYQFPAHSVFLKGGYHYSPLLSSVNLQTILLQIRAYGACNCGQVNHPARQSAFGTQARQRVAARPEPPAPLCPHGSMACISHL